MTLPAEHFAAAVRIRDRSDRLMAAELRSALADYEQLRTGPIAKLAVALDPSARWTIDVKTVASQDAAVGMVLKAAQDCARKTSSLPHLDDAQRRELSRYLIGTEFEGTVYGEEAW